ncbi:MAG TPA: DUF5668 domain-containing protein [Vicinamibacterales bacterium]
MTIERPPVLTPQAAIGVAIALVGIVFTLDNLGLTDAGLVLRFWPVIPIGVGAVIVMHARNAKDWLLGFAWTAGGVLFLLRNLGVLEFELRDLLPLLLVALGVRLIWGGASRQPQGRTASAGTAAATLPDVEPAAAPPPPPPFTPPPVPPRAEASTSTHARRSGGGKSCRGWTGAEWWQRHGFHMGSSSEAQDGQWSGRTSPGGTINVFAFLSGVERRPRGKPFKGAQLVALMGACELDLRQATPGAEVMHVSAFALWGGIEIRVPSDWIVVNESMALLGGIEDSSRPPTPDRGPRVIVHGAAVMGGIEIKN